MFFDLLFYKCYHLYVIDYINVFNNENMIGVGKWRKSLKDYL